MNNYNAFEEALEGNWKKDPNAIQYKEETIKALKDMKEVEQIIALQKKWRESKKPIRKALREKNFDLAKKLINERISILDKEIYIIKQLKIKVNNIPEPKTKEEKKASSPLFRFYVWNARDLPNSYTISTGNGYITYYYPDQMSKSTSNAYKRNAQLQLNLAWHWAEEAIYYYNRHLEKINKKESNFELKNIKLNTSNATRGTPEGGMESFFLRGNLDIDLTALESAQSETPKFRSIKELFAKEPNEYNKRRGLINNIEIVIRDSVPYSDDSIKSMDKIINMLDKVKYNLAKTEVDIYNNTHGKDGPWSWCDDPYQKRTINDYLKNISDSLIAFSKTDDNLHVEFWFVDTDKLYTLRSLYGGHSIIIDADWIIKENKWSDKSNPLTNKIDIGIGG